MTNFRLGLAESHNDLGRLHARAKRFPEAFTALDTGLAIRETLAQGAPSNPDYARDLALSYACRGWARIRAANLSQPPPTCGGPSNSGPNFPTCLDIRFERARVTSLLAGLGKDAKSGVTAAEAAAFADQATAALRDAIKVGWTRKPDELKEPDFDSLRDREDFQKLRSELDTKTSKPPVTH